MEDPYIPDTSLPYDENFIEDYDPINIQYNSGLINWADLIEDNDIFLNSLDEEDEETDDNQNTVQAECEKHTNTSISESTSGAQYHLDN